MQVLIYWKARGQAQYPGCYLVILCLYPLCRLPCAAARGLVGLVDLATLRIKLLTKMPCSWLGSPWSAYVMVFVPQKPSTEKWIILPAILILAWRRFNATAIYVCW